MKGANFVKKRIVLLAALCLLLLLAACGKRIDYSLPENPTEFVTEDYVNPNDPEDGYRAIVFSGRIYIPYGTLKGALRGEDIGKCLGYLVQDGQKDENSRVFLLTDDAETNFLAVLEVEGVMNQPAFYRAVDTAGRAVAVPKFINDLDYDFWK